MRIGIVGLGNLGSAVAYLTGSNGHQVTAWEYDADVVDECNRFHRNSRFLPGRRLPESVLATRSLAEAGHGAELLFVTLPSRFIEPVLGPFAAEANPALPLVNMSKGIDAGTGRTAYQMLADLFPHNPKAMVAGPSLANEFARGVVTAVIAASSVPALFPLIRSAMSNNRFAVATSEDVAGVEWGAILKNIYALGLGLMEGREEAGLNFSGAYLTQALKEMTALGRAMGARAGSFLALSGLGDLIATALSENSHNHTMGRLLAQGLSLEEIKQQMSVLPEGYNTLGAALTLARRQSVALPLAGLLHDVIHGDADLAEFFPRFTAILATQV